MNNEFKGKIIFSENYSSTIENIRLINNTTDEKAKITKALHEQSINYENSDLKIISSSSFKRLFTLNDLKKAGNTTLSAYDESILELNSLEGKVRCITHSIVLQNQQEYVPAAYVTLKFFTKSKIVHAKSNEFSDVIYCEDVAKNINDEYIKERSFFLDKVAPSNTYIYIDGSMFSGASTSGNFLLIDNLLQKNCKPIFFVKNSESTIITERFNFAKGYNSDLHWAYANLKQGEFSDIFAYTSPDGRGKAMCFFKAFNKKSPIRIEFPLKAFLDGLYDDDNVFENIYYQYLASGNSHNTQTRMIEVAEMYAREILKSTNLYKEIERMGLTKTMNDERGF